MTIVTEKVALISGISGQDGFYLAELLVGKGYQLFGTTHRREAAATIRLSGHDVPIVYVDLTDAAEVRSLMEHVQPDEIYNLAARSSSAQLFDDPIATAEINGVAVVRLLEALRRDCPRARICQASSSEVFGKATIAPQDEKTPLRPRNAYGAAKAFAQNMVESYRERFGLFACSAILFNHESPRRAAEYVTRKVSLAAARIAAGQDDSLKLGNLDARRDWGYAADYVRAMWLMLQHSVPEDYVVATGKSHSIRDLCQIAFERVGLDYRAHVTVDPELARGAEAVELLGKASKARTTLGWSPGISFAQLVAMMVDADVQALKDTVPVQQSDRAANVPQDR